MTTPIPIVRAGGLVTDHWDRTPLVSTCVHGNEWPEGDRFTDAGGLACRECVEATKIRAGVSAED